MKLRNIVISFLLIPSAIFSQQKWSADVRMTKIYSTGEYIPLPQIPENFYKPNLVRYVPTPGGTFIVNPNFRVHPTNNNTQSELAICVNPVNRNIIFGSSNAVTLATTFISEGIYVSTNGGLNWFGSDTCNGAPIGNHGGDPGPTIDRNGRFLISHLGLSTSGMYANYSTNNGVSWSGTYTIVTGSQDKNFSGTDDAPTSPYYGRSYTVWSRFTASLPPIAISYTTNGGVSWSASANINNPPGGHYSQGCDIRVGPNGEVFVCWAAPIAQPPYTEDFCGFARSTNGGVSWTVTESAYDMNGIRGNFANKNGIRVNGFTRIDVDRSNGPRRGWIYIVAAEQNLAPAGIDPDIVLHRSTNNGSSWSAGIRVNQDPINLGKYQWLPVVRVDSCGRVHVVYYDDRNVSANAAEVWLSTSTDGGTTWTDMAVSDHLHVPAPIAGLAPGYAGDYIGVTSSGNTLYPFWMDNSSGIYQAWTNAVTLPNCPLVGITEEQNTPKEFKLYQNYPNPFNPETKIRFDVPASPLSFGEGVGVRLLIFDILGREIWERMVRQDSYGGGATYEIEFDGTNFPSGVYFYTLTTQSFNQTKRMVLLK